MHEQEIQAELANIVARRERLSIASNLIALLLIAIALSQLVSLLVTLLMVGQRLASMAVMRYISVRTRRAIARNEPLESYLRIFTAGTFVVALSWSILLIPLQPADFTTFPGLLLATLIALGIAMIALMTSPIPQAFQTFMATFTICLASYIGWRLATFGPLTLLIILLAMGALYALGRALGREARTMAEAAVRNRWLTENLKIALAEAERLSRTDALTGLFNRRYFHDHASDYLKDEAATASVMIIDLDHFKNINDCAGHAVGDSVLQAVGNLLRAICARDHLRDAVAARIGGEEFAIFIPNQTGAEIEKQTDNLRRTISGLAAFNWSGKIDLSASIGLAYRRSGETLGEMLHRADMALYGAKKSGRDQIKLAA